MKMGLAAGAGIFFLPSILPSSFAQSVLGSDTQKTKIDEDPHFFLMLTLENASGFDASYLWDARPIEMTEKGLIQNYRTKKTTIPWVGSNGVSCLSTDIAQALLPYQSNFSVINGAMMDVGFDGHEQNINYLFTGDPFGGEGFIPHLNLAGANHRALDAIQRGRFSPAMTNAGQSVPLDPQAAKSLISTLKSLPPLDPNSKLFRFLSNRFQANGMGDGSFSAASLAMNTALASSSGLAQMISQIKTDGENTDASFVKLAGEVFRTGAAKAAVLVMDAKNNIFDTHAPQSAQVQQKTYSDWVDSMGTILKTLKETPFDATRSLLDVTTFMFSAEFGRTMRQMSAPIDQTGTDHNPLTNCVLVGGKGIRGGQVIGSTDFANADEVLSGAHLSLDKEKLKTMGRPFDFAKGTSRTDLPAAYSATDYLGFNSVVNTVYSVFNVPQSRWRLVERNGDRSKVISQLLL